jgi:hypothetical protein
MKNYNAITTTDKILLGILEMLEEINGKLTQKEVKIESEVISTPVAEEPVAEVKPKKDSAGKRVCSTCGQVHEFGYEYGVCARKNKKAGV